MDTELTFNLPDTLTVRQQLAIKSRLAAASGDSFAAAFWEAGREFVRDWTCELVPDPMVVNIDTETDPNVANVIFSAGVQIALWFRGLGDVEKN